MGDLIDDWIQRSRGRELVAAIDDFIDEVAPSRDEEAYGFPHGWRSIYRDGASSCTPVGSAGESLRCALEEARKFMIETGKRGALIGTIVASPSNPSGPIGIPPEVFNSWLELSRSNNLEYRDSSGCLYTFFNVRIGPVSDAVAPIKAASKADMKEALCAEIAEAKRLGTRPGRDSILNGAQKRLESQGKRAKSKDLREEYRSIPDKQHRGRPRKTPAR